MIALTLSVWFFTLIELEKDISWKSQFKAQNRITNINIFKYEYIVTIQG